MELMLRHAVNYFNMKKSKAVTSSGVLDDEDKFIGAARRSLARAARAHSRQGQRTSALGSIESVCAGQLLVINSGAPRRDHPLQRAHPNYDWQSARSHPASTMRAVLASAHVTDLYVGDSRRGL
jgi:hypothetical protein